MSEEKKTVKVTSISMDEEVYRWALEKAQAENRTLSNWIETQILKIKEEKHG